jgi:hypothetical protein
MSYDYDAEAYTVDTDNQNQKRHNRRLALKFAEYGFYVIAGVLVFYSATPWIEVGHAIGNEIVTTRFYGALMNIPIAGLLFKLLQWVLLNALGVGLWFIVNAIQVTPILMKIPPVYAAIVDWLKQQREPDSDNPKIHKMQTAMAEWLLNAFESLGLYAGLAYLVELAVNLYYYAPYKGGWGAFIKDAPLWATDKILFIQLFMMFGSIAAVEILFLFVLTVYRIFRAVER